MNFSERLKKRLRLWWLEPAALRDVRPQHLAGLVQRFDQRFLPVQAHHSMDRWRRGRYWQRRLLHKLNARQFAMKLGCDVPVLYWQGHWITPSVISSLPDSFVIKPTRGKARQGVYVMHHDRELLSGRELSVGELFVELRKKRGKLSLNSLLAEEFVRTETGEYILPIEYKVHVFCRAIGAIQVIHRGAKGSATGHRFYTEHWQPFEDNLNTEFAMVEVEEPPACLGQLLADAVTLGSAWGTYVRVDMYASHRGPLFGEFSSTPDQGHHFSRFADDFFGRLWDRECPQQI